jgi:hypothetical protein
MTNEQIIDNLEGFVVRRLPWHGRKITQQVRKGTLTEAPPHTASHRQDALNHAV